MKKLKIISLILFILSSALLRAQTEVSVTEGNEKDKKTVEIGLGLDMHNLSRVGFQNYKSSTEGDRYSIRIRDVMFGGNIYIARELNPWFYLDLQGTIGTAKSFDASDVGKSKNKMFAMVGPGIQFRLTPLFKKKYVEPYFRVGVNYYYKDFLVARSNKLQNFEGNYLEWMHTDEFNDKVDSKKHFIPFSFGFGVNSWFNDHVGFGIQGDYLTTFNSKKLSFPRVMARVMVRFGGSKEKKVVSQPEIRYVEKIVTKEVPVEKIIEKEIIIDKTTDPLFLLFSNINFDFDKSTILAESEKTLDDIALILKNMMNEKFLISGFTDARGSSEYNKVLSERRAEAVKNALVKRGISSSILKSRGVGKAAASMHSGETSNAREGDRKVTIELIRNMEYWNKLP